jgi:proline iminopeptidase
MSAACALDLPINESGGPEHTKLALQGKATTVTPANYSFVSTDGTRIVYHVCGGGPTLVVATCPGWGVGLNYLPAGFSELYNNGKVTLVAVQTRGTLPSEHPADETRMGSRHMAADLDALRIHLGQDRINVFGHSNGAAIALAYAELFPEHCSKAVLIETQVIGYKNFGADIKRALEKRVGDERYTDAINTFTDLTKRTMRYDSDENMTNFLQDVLTLYFFDPETHLAEFAASMGPRLIQFWPSSKQEGPDSSPEADLVQGLNKVTADVLFISGADDFICSTEMSRMAAEVVGSKARHVVYEKCGHMPWVENKDQFYKDVLAFLGA